MRVKIMKSLMFIVVISFCFGCVSKRYDRVTFTVDPNGWFSYEHVSGGITGIAADTKFDSLEVETDSRKIKIKKFKESQDSIKAIIPTVGIVETSE